MAMDKQRKTFLSYSRVNKEFAIRLANELKSEGFDVWLDQLDIEPGAWWDDEVERALEECEIFMVIITPSSSASKNVKDEIGYALDNQKRILPILLENATLPLRLRRLQYVDFTAKGFDEGVNAAKDLLRKLMAQSTLPRMELSEEQRQQVAQAEAERKAAKAAEQLAAQTAESEHMAQQRAEEERATKAKAEEEGLAQQRAEEEHLAKAKAEREAKAEADRKVKAESRRKAKEEADRLAAQKVEEERLAKQKAEAELAAQKAEAELRTKQETERLAAQKAEEDRLAKQKMEAELAAKARAEKERAAKEEAERTSSKPIEQRAVSQAEMPLVPVTAQAAQQSVPVAAAPRRPMARGLMYGVAAFVLICGGIGFGVLSSLMNRAPSTPPDTVANTAVPAPTDVPTRAANPTNTSVPIPEATARPTNTPVPTSAPSEIEVVNFTVQGPWKNVTNCPQDKEPCWTDSPGGPYANDMYHAIISPEISVDETWENPYLVYWQKYNTEGEYDFVQIKINDVAVRTNSGTTEWHQIAVALESYKGQEIVVQFLMATDYSIVGDGWYLHDIKIIPNATSEELQSARIVEP